MPISRKKACRACRAAKARCSLTAPCTRCQGKQLQCDYRGNAVSDQSPRQSRALLPARCADAQMTPQELLNGSNTSREGCDRDLVDPEPRHREFDALDSELTSTILWDIDPLYSTGNPSINMLEFGTTCHESLFRWTTNIEPSLILDSPGVTIPRELLSTLPSTNSPETMATRRNVLTESVFITNPRNSSRLLHPRRMATLDTFFTAKVLVGQLLSYPRMLVSGYRLPPFIHPPCAMSISPVDCPSDEPHRCLTAVLAVCVGLLRMFFARTPGNCDFVWEQIYLHQRQLRAEYQSYDLRTLVEALQVLTIYILLQAGDLGSVNENAVRELILTTIDIATRLQILYDVKSSHHSRQHLSRQDWVLLESGRRTYCILYGIELLIAADLSGNTGAVEAECSGFMGLPLPCGRELWDPVEDREWRRRYQKALLDKSLMNMEELTIADLTHARRPSIGQDHDSWLSNSERGKEIARWCSTADDFGILLWTAVGMAEG